jgi:DNA-binding IclR family transcriptional regulator
MLIVPRWKGLLAHLEPARIEAFWRNELPQRDEEHNNQAASLQKDLEKVRVSGYAIARSGGRHLLCGGSTHGIGGEVMAAISISGLSERLRERLETHLRCAVQLTVEYHRGFHLTGAGK